MKIKKLYIFFLSALCAGASLTSCTDLDSDKYLDDRTKLSDVFAERNKAEAWLAQAYTWLLDCNIEVGSKGETGQTMTIVVDGKQITLSSSVSWNPFNFDDDIYYGDRDNTIGAGDKKDGDFASYNSFHEGNYNEHTGYNSWVRCYKGIYQASVFIHNVHKIDEFTDDEVEDYRGQARFVRAYYYWLLLKKFGPVPIMPDEGVDYTLSYDDLATPRSTYEEVAEYISSEMLQAAKELKYTKRDANNIGRPTIGAALATRALAYMYAASPLANGQLKNGVHDASVKDDVAKMLVNRDGTHLLSLEYDESKWARAAAACKDVMNLGVYELYHVSRVGTGTEVPVYDDGNFSTKSWPDGYADVDAMQSYRNLFNGAVTASENPELIFTRGSNITKGNHTYGIGSLVQHEMPQSMKGWNTHGVTQKMVDTYYMADGTDVDGMYSEWKKGITTSDSPNGNTRKRQTNTFTRDEVKAGISAPELGKLSNAQMLQISKQYVGREPRFYASVAYSGSIWEALGAPSATDQNQFICYYRNGFASKQNGWVNNYTYPRTGIGMKKYYHPSDYIDTRGSYTNITMKWEPAIRYADILLMYAEALNELTKSYQVKSWDGSATYTISRDINEIKKGTNPVRIRAGLPDYSAATYSDAKILRQTIKRERMIEFMGETKRYYDLRRWMDAPVEEATVVYGLNVFMTAANKDQFYKVIPTYNLSATFSDKMYFLPISFTELKRNKNLVQNPGWKEND